MSRNELHITRIDERHFADLAAEYVDADRSRRNSKKGGAAVAAAADASSPSDPPQWTT